MLWLITYRTGEHTGENYCVVGDVSDAITIIASVWNIAIAKEIGRQITEAAANMGMRPPTEPAPKLTASMIIPSELTGNTGFHGFIHLAPLSIGEWFGCLQEDDGLTPPPQDPVR